MLTFWTLNIIKIVPNCPPPPIIATGKVPAIAVPSRAIPIPSPIPAPTPAPNAPAVVPPIYLPDASR
ncbi:hypothetical protein [Nostoc sp.]|uniref:hypothetical protein n=1 Tax=Nostoc sp. TaxID=1180 RepID=UPI002FF8E284